MFPVRLWLTVQQKVYQLPFCLDRRWLQKQKKVKSSLKIRRSVCNETGRILWYRPALKQQLKFSLYSSQARHQTTTYVRYQGESEVLKWREDIAIINRSLLHTFPPAREVLCRFITTKFIIADKPRSGGITSAEWLWYIMIVQQWVKNKIVLCSKEESTSGYRRGCNSRKDFSRNTEARRQGGGRIRSERKKIRSLQCTSCLK